MTLITAILDRASRKCSVSSPDSWVAATDQNSIELRDDFMAETIDDLSKRVDWPSPIGKQQVITGDGSEGYALSTDFVRLANDENAIFETNTTRRSGQPIGSDGDWTRLKATGTAGGARYYRLAGYDGNFSIDFYPALTAGETITVSYVSNLWMATSAGTVGAVFTDDTDVSLFPRRLVETGIVWRFRKRKGLSYQDERDEYEAHMATVGNRARGIRKVSFGTYTGSGHPMKYPTPDFIPSS